MSYNYIRLYKGNPTAGGTDGTPIRRSDDDGYLPLRFTFDVIQNDSQIVPVAIRTDTGYKTKGSTTIEVPVNQDLGKIKLCKTPDGEFSRALTFTDPITDANTLFYVKAIAQSGESINVFSYNLQVTCLMTRDLT